MRITDETQILCGSQGIYKLRKQREQAGDAEKYFQKKPESLDSGDPGM
jgi:hypothetical protein